MLVGLGDGVGAGSGLWASMLVWVGAEVGSEVWT